MDARHPPQSQRDDEPAWVRHRARVERSRQRYVQTERHDDDETVEDLEQFNKLNVTMTTKLSKICNNS